MTDTECTSSRSSRPYTLDYSPTEEILVTDPTELVRKLRKFIREGPSHVEVVSDYDYTLSAASVAGRQTAVSYGVLMSLLDDEQRRRAKELTDYYLPLQRDASIPSSQKNELMQRWERQGHALVLDSSLSKEHIEHLTFENDLVLRHGIDRVFRLCEAYHLPFTVVSGGVGNVIEASLREVCDVS